MFAVGPKAIAKANHNFLLPDDMSLTPEVMQKLLAEYKEFNYEIDTIFDLSSDVSEGAALDNTLSLKSYDIFDEFDRLNK